MSKRAKFAKRLLIALALLALVVGSAALTAVPATAAGKWFAEYFDNISLSGSPVRTRYDDPLKFDWGYGSPHSDIPADNFSARWTRDEWFMGGTYRFWVVSDDGVRVWVGGQLVVDEWRDRLPGVITADRYIAPGVHPVRVEYYEHLGSALIAVSWDRVAGGATWVGEYFDNRKFEGSPVLTRGDSAIDFDWGTGSPDPAVPADHFSVRWTRTIGLTAGTYRFLTSTDDGVRVWVDGRLVIDKWYDMKLPNTHTGDIYLDTGDHKITVEYYERGDKAHAHFWWHALGSFAGWHGRYFDNPDMVGGPALERSDAAINFDWGIGPPVDWMPDDNFSAYWTRTVNFTPGYYRFAILADDGVRLWIDDGLLIDEWRDANYELHYVDGTYLQGQHTLRLEYYEHTGHARVRFWWESSSDGNAPPVSYGGPTAPPDDDPWESTYFANTYLRGTPVLMRVETALDHNWGWGSPGAGVPKDYFSARWTQPLYFEAGTYRFTTYTDDGVRLWVDGRLVIDSWQPMRGYRSATVWLNRGTHDVKMEYYERTGVALARLTWQRVSR